MKLFTTSNEKNNAFPKVFCIREEQGGSGREQNFGDLFVYGGYKMIRKLNRPMPELPLMPEHTAFNEIKPPPTSQLCECGCLEYAKPGNRFIVGHNIRGKNNPFYGSHRLGELSPMYNHVHTIKAIEKMSLANTGKNNPMYGKTGELAPGYGRCGELNGMYGKYGELCPNFGKTHTPEQNEQDSLNKKALWQDPEYREKQWLGRCKSVKILPNKMEIYLLKILEQMFPGEWRYTGNFSFIINGRNPDFVNRENNKIIEFYGDHWHQGDDPQDRINIFKPCGYDTLVIWGHELKNLTRLKFRINKFMNQNR